MSWLLLCASLCIAAHLAAVVIAAMRFGIPVREVHFGWGPTLLRIGRLRLKPIVVAGSVRLKNATDEGLSEEAAKDAFDRQPRSVRMLVAAAGPLTLLMLALLAFPVDGLALFLDGFAQYIGGALSPLGTAQQLLGHAEDAARRLGFFALLGLVAAKLAAFNLLPLPGSSGGFVLQVLFEGTALARRWPPRATQAALALFLASSISWLAALAAYLLQGSQ